MGAWQFLLHRLFMLRVDTSGARPHRLPLGGKGGGILWNSSIPHLLLSAPRDGRLPGSAGALGRWLLCSGRVLGRCLFPLGLNGSQIIATFKNLLCRWQFGLLLVCILSISTLSVRESNSLWKGPQIGLLRGATPPPPPASFLCSAEMSA